MPEFSKRVSIRQSREPGRSFVHAVLGIPGPDGTTPDTLRIGALVNALIADPLDMASFFNALAEVTIHASEQAAGFETPATILRELREVFGSDLLRLSEEVFSRIVWVMFTPGMAELKHAYRRECLVAMDTRISVRGKGAKRRFLPVYDHPGVTAKVTEFFRKNCSVLMGAWDAFGAALVEEATQRGLNITRPNTRHFGSRLDEEIADLLVVFHGIVAEKTVGDPARLAAKALRLVMSLPAGEGLACQNVLAGMRKAADIPSGRAGNKVFALLFRENFRQAARQAENDPSLAMAMQCWCTWMRQQAASVGIAFLDHDTLLVLKNFETGLAQPDE